MNQSFCTTLHYNSAFFETWTGLEENPDWRKTWTRIKKILFDCEKPLT
jgi:hypothetical protein